VGVHECPTCGVPSGVTCVRAGQKERPPAGQLEEMNHEARRRRHETYRRELRRRRREQNPLIQTGQDDG